ncbi:carbamoyl-phosphate synthase large chain [Campylobacter sp. 9BO]|uniref:prepilin-type N-terminal cleavage/methylation domain-containing protein n=1 Tax=Campylobacter sp. 9BO TaxID=3424759 RepID=UPI003D344C04
MEIVLIIVIIGILTTISLPKLKFSSEKFLTEQILMHLRYTQQLAMQDSKFNLGENWQKKRWTLVFANTKLSTKSCNIDSDRSWKYSIYWDNSISGNLNSKQEVARNPLKTHMYLSSGWSGISSSDCKFISPELNIGKKYGVRNVVLEGGCKGGLSISFDEFGRPMMVVSTTTGGGAKRGYDRLLKEDCKINITTLDAQILININHRTGFTCAIDQETKKCKMD